MSDEASDAATMQALLERMVKFRLPRALAIKARVDAGERLEDSEFDFLKRAMEDARDAQKYVARNPEFQAIGTQAVGLFDEIVRKALQNETNPPRTPRA